jgi:hypothetical protein
MLMWPRRRRAGQPAQVVAGPSFPPSYVGYAPAATVPPLQPAPAWDVDEAARLSTVPMPYDVAADHHGVFVFATQQGHVDHDPAELMRNVFEALSRAASQRGCDGVYGIQHTVSVDNGAVYITAIGTGSRPIVDLDQAPPGTPQT